MGEAEDAVARRQQQKSEVSDEEMREFRIINTWIGELIPQAVANIRRHNYPDRYLKSVRYNGESRVAWELWSNGDGIYVLLLGDGQLVLDLPGRLEVSPYTLSPRSTWPYKINEEARKIKERLQLLATTDFT